MNYKEKFAEATKPISHLITPAFVEWLDEKGFFTAPASLRYHGATVGGLCSHSLNVTTILQGLTNDCWLKWSRPESPVIIGLFHDLCKIEEYTYTVIGEELDGTQIVDSHSWERRPRKEHVYTGHGEKSVLLLAPWIQLTAEEVACIRWHMGAFDDQENWSGYTNAIHTFPNVLWTHHADMIAAHIMED